MSVVSWQGAFRIAPYATPSDVSSAVSGLASINALNDALADKADASALNTLNNSVSTISSSLAGKANVADVNALNTIVQGKADASALDGKADVSALDLKADLSALDSKADQSAVDNLSNALDDKANASDMLTAQGQISALNQMADILCGPQGALQVPQVPGGSTDYVYDGTFQTF